MKNTIRLCAFLLAALVTNVGHAQNAKSPAASGKHRVVFEVTRAGEDQWKGVVNNIKNLREALGLNDTEVMVIAHSNGLGLLVQKDNKLAPQLKELADAGVVFAACENTMKKKNVTKDQLLPFATTVDSGVAETVRKEEAGWSYIKSGI